MRIRILNLHNLEVKEDTFLLSDENFIDYMHTIEGFEDGRYVLQVFEKGHCIYMKGFETRHGDTILIDQEEKKLKYPAKLLFARSKDPIMKAIIVNASDGEVHSTLFETREPSMDISGFIEKLDAEGQHSLEIYNLNRELLLSAEFSLNQPKPITNETDL